ncbi:hypothetical protein [Phormidium pseudopriestleyi]|nr:hypothetical protein [Phormidium pseudopriestleyi]
MARPRISPGRSPNNCGDRPVIVDQLASRERKPRYTPLRLTG